MKTSAEDRFGAGGAYKVCRIGLSEAHPVPPLFVAHAVMRPMIGLLLTLTAYAALPAQTLFCGEERTK